MIYTLYKKYCELNTEFHDPIAVSSCQIDLARKDNILLSNVSVMFYNTGSRTGVENNGFIKFNVLAGAYLINDFTEEIKAAVLQQRQDWEPPQIKDLKLIMPEHYTFYVCNIIFIMLVIHNNYLNLAPWLIINIV